jgi:hypothetical protein
VVCFSSVPRAPEDEVTCICDNGAGLGPQL